MKFDKGISVIFNFLSLENQKDFAFIRGIDSKWLIGSHETSGNDSRYLVLFILVYFNAVRSYNL